MAAALDAARENPDRAASGRARYLAERAVAAAVRYAVIHAQSITAYGSARLDVVEHEQAR